MNASLTSSQWWQVEVWALVTDSSFWSMPNRAVREKKTKTRISFSKFFHFRHFNGHPSSIEPSSTLCSLHYWQSSDLPGEMWGPAEALAGENEAPDCSVGRVFKRGRRACIREKNGSRNCSIGSGSFRIQFNPGLVVKGRGWKSGERDSEKARGEKGEK